jgi:hypothetical protein
MNTAAQRYRRPALGEERFRGNQSTVKQSHEARSNAALNSQSGLAYEKPSKLSNDNATVFLSDSHENFFSQSLGKASHTYLSNWWNLVSNALPKDTSKTVIHFLDVEGRKSIPNARLIHSAEYSGEVVKVEGPRVIIEFKIDGDREQREFSKEELTNGDEFLRIGSMVVARTTLRVLPPSAQPTKEEMEMAKTLFEKEAKDWMEIDPSQIAPRGEG